jgi:hypothetical protein
VGDSGSPSASERPRLLWWKVVAIWALFLLLHFSYETFPNALFRIIGEEGETTFFHMKMLFFAYLFVTAVELLARRKTIRSLQSFAFSRMLIAVAYPWLTITIWFTAQALGIHVPVIPWEIIYANVVTLIGIYMAVRMEELFTETEFRPSMKVLIALTFTAAVLSYVSFSLSVPMPFFTTPPEF